MSVCPCLFDSHVLIYSQSGHTLAFFCCFNLSLHLHSLVGECLLLACHFFSVLTCLSICALQNVSAPYWLAFLYCFDLFLYLYYLGSKYSHWLTFFLYINIIPLLHSLGCECLN